MVPGSIPGDRISQPMQRKTQIETPKWSTYLARPISSFKSMYLCMACMSHQFQRDFWLAAFAFRQIRWGISEGLKNISGKTHPMVLQSARVSVYISVCIYVSVYVHTCDCVTFIRHCLIQFRWIISLGSCVYFHGFIFLGKREDTRRTFRECGYVF